MILGLDRNAVPDCGHQITIRPELLLRASDLPSSHKVMRSGRSGPIHHEVKVVHPRSSINRIRRHKKVT